MNLNMGSQRFENVQIPLLWGKRAILEDEKKRISIISLDGPEARLEILGNKPAPKIKYELIEHGYKIFENDVELYSFDPEKKIITGLSLKLPECEIQASGIIIGTNRFSGTVSGFGVGIVVDEHGMGIGAPLPEGLAKLKV
jgi:hypothetical protein